ncbi:hypothetical protein ACLOJK_036733, partial [Asimina triloba]
VPAYRLRVSVSSPGSSKSFLRQREWRRAEATRRRSFASGTKPSLKDRLGAGGQAFWAGRRQANEGRHCITGRLQEAKLRRLDDVAYRMPTTRGSGGEAKLSKLYKADHYISRLLRKLFELPFIRFAGA